MTAAALLPRIEIDGRPASMDDLRAVAFGTFGHFTALQVRGGRTRGFALHVARLDAANRELFGQPLAGDRLRELVRHALGEDADAAVRVVVTQPTAGADVAVAVTVRPPGEAPLAPYRVRAVAYQRSVAHIKHSAGFAQEHYRRLARADGYDEVLLTTADGVISEGGITNVGFVDRSGVVWPDAPALTGVTMQLVEDALAARGVACRRQSVRLTDVPSFQGMFLTNARGVVPVAWLDGQQLPVPEAFMATLTEAYAAVPWEPI
jgi:branched-subunit amino acid aminotransferase/4-amino-4-deoxychorismate lyase